MFIEGQLMIAKGAVLGAKGNVARAEGFLSCYTAQGNAGMVADWQGKLAQAQQELKDAEEFVQGLTALTAEACKASLVDLLEFNFVSPEVFSVEDIAVIEGQHMPNEARVTATCHYTKGSENVRQQVEFYWDCWDAKVYADSPV